MTGPAFQIGNLGEIALRCRDLAAMTAFYRDILRLTPLNDPNDPIRFFNLAPGFQGHTQVLALFSDAGPGVQVGAGSSLHHFAFGIAAQDQLAAQSWLNAHGHATRYERFDWVGWRGLFTTDPDGNTVELVAHIGDAGPICRADLDAALPHILAAPKTDAPILSLCLRPARNERAFPGQLTLTRAAGIPGERWLTEPWLTLPAGAPHPGIQVSILPARVADLVWRDRGASPHPGDPIIADLDCTEANLPVGSLIQVGSAVLRVSDVWNNGCVKWKARYGEDAYDWARNPATKALRLRGILCSVEHDGRITLTDRLTVLSRG